MWFGDEPVWGHEAANGEWKHPSEEGVPSKQLVRLGWRNDLSCYAVLLYGVFYGVVCCVGNA